MAATFLTQPASASFNSAYNPVVLIVGANDTYVGGACQIVYADVYFNNFYFGTLSSSVYRGTVGPYYVYYFDIEDKCQEYLRSELVAGVGASQNNGLLRLHSTNCKVKIRETYVDSNGFVASAYGAPIAGTMYTDPVDGGGLESNSFTIFNTRLKQEDSTTLLTHLKKYTPAWYLGGAFDTGWNLSHRPNNIPAYNAKIGAGKYWVGYNDHDIFSFATTLNLSTLVGFSCQVIINYLDGSTGTQNKSLSTWPTPFPASSYGSRSYYANCGIVNLKLIYTALTWTKIDYYTVYFYAPFQDLATQRYYVKNDGSKNERVRLLFCGLLGGYDGINFLLNTETSSAESALFQRSMDIVSPSDYSKRERSIGRFQPMQSEVIEVFTEDYGEEDQAWLKEVVGSAQAYIQVAPDSLQGQTELFFPVNILDGSIVSKKKEDSFVYTLTLKFTLGYDYINLRS